MHGIGFRFGFVNLVGDGVVHAFLLDPTVHPHWQRRGLGTRLVRTAADVARAQGAEWLHVDYEPHLDAFYRACGFTLTLAGLLGLDAPPAHDLMIGAFSDATPPTDPGGDARSKGMDNARFNRPLTVGALLTLGLILIGGILSACSAGLGAPAAQVPTPSHIPTRAPTATVPATATVSPATSTVLRATPTLPPATPSVPPATLPAGLTGVVAWLDETCRFSTLNLADGARWIRATPVRVLGSDDLPCVMTAADARGWLAQPTTRPAPAVLRVPTAEAQVLHARSGQAAWIAPRTGGAVLHLRDRPDGPVRTYPIERPHDAFVDLIAYVADDTRVLAATWFASSGTMTDGMSLLLIDPDTGTVTDLGIRAHWNPATILINPVRRHLVAIAPSTVRIPGVLPNCRLLVLDAATAQMTCVTTFPVQTAVWSDDGDELVFVIRSGTILLRNIADLTVDAQVIPAPAPQTAILGWLAPDWLLILTYDQAQDAMGTAITPPTGTIALLQRDTGQIVALAEGVPPPRCYPNCAYHQLVVYLPVEDAGQ